MMTVDFTSALFLGLIHPHETLSWSTLTTGTPAALRQSPAAIGAARDFAALVGCDRALAMTSSLHAFSDLFGESWRSPSVIVHDEAVYPIARWMMERAERRGARLVPFRHLDASDLEACLRRLPAPASRAPASGFATPVWVVTDGFCAGCARPAPLDAYAAMVRRWEGLLVIDDAQALGLYGRNPTAAAPYGRGGGGSLCRLRQREGLDVLLVASLAKALGAPLTMVAGAAPLVAAFASHSETLVHCSPPSAPALAAARRALALSALGDALRVRLATRVRFLRAALRERGFAVRGDLFPMQRVPMPDADAAAALQGALARRGVTAVVRRSRCNDEISLTFVVTARHTEEQLHRAALALTAVAGARPRLTAGVPRPRLVLTPVPFNLED